MSEKDLDFLSDCCPTHHIELATSYGVPTLSLGPTARGHVNSDELQANYTKTVNMHEI